VSETQDLIEGNGTRPVISGTVGHSTLVSNKQWIVIQVGLQPRSQALCPLLPPEIEVGGFVLVRETVRRSFVNNIILFSVYLISMQTSRSKLLCFLITLDSAKLSG